MYSVSAAAELPLHEDRLHDIVSQLDPVRRNVVEFRHASWWNEEVYTAFRKAGIVFCSAADRACPTNSSEQLMTFISACTAQSSGIVTTTQKMSSRYRRIG